MALLSVEELEKSFPGRGGREQLIVSVEGFELAAGEQVALTGPSGCGKTTFLHLVAGILAASSGRLEVGKTALTDLSETGRDRFRAETVGYVFQGFHLMRDFTCLENVELGMTFGGSVDRGFARSLLERVGLGDRMEHRASELSVGQQQRVALARALANRPKLVLADEPTASLDEDNADKAIRLLREMCDENGAALLLATHDRRLAESFDRRIDFADLNAAMQKPEAAKK